MAIEKMRQIAQSIFDQTPGLKEDESKILAGVKEKKRQLEKAAENKKEYKIEDFESAYKQGIDQYKDNKSQVKAKKDDLEQNQQKYIRRETEYRDVIDKLGKKIKYHSTNPLEVIEEKTEEQYRLKGIDMTDPE